MFRGGKDAVHGRGNFGRRTTWPAMVMAVGPCSSTSTTLDRQGNNLAAGLSGPRASCYTGWATVGCGSADLPACHPNAHDSIGTRSAR